MLTVVLFATGAAAVVLMWNHFFEPVATRIAVFFFLIVSVYQAGTLLTSKVDIPGNLAFVAYPWRAKGRPAVHANTGIVFTQIAPWTQAARRSLDAGQMPFWNRASASGAPLLSNQQTAIFHPFTLLGLFLPLGKAFTLTVCLRLFTVLFFTFLFVRHWGLSEGAAIFGAVAYAFCTFHVVWLLFPLGLASMMLPGCLVGVQQVLTDPRPAAVVLLVVFLAATVLGGHPESAMWVWIVTILFTLYAAFTTSISMPARAVRIAIVACVFVAAMVLTAFFWLPTLRILRTTTRFQAMQSPAANPTNHQLSYEWLLPLLAQNVLGNPVKDTYTPPSGSHPAVLNDYGEVCSGYAGLATLGLALAAPFAARQRPLAFAYGLMIFALFSIAEVPIWRDLLRQVPLAGISLHQRLRIFWDFGACIAASIALDHVAQDRSRRGLRIGLAAVAIAFAAVYLSRHPAWLATSKFAIAQAVIPIVTTIGVGLCVSDRRNRTASAAAALVLLDLAVATYRYNPSASPGDVYPVTPAIATLQHQRPPFRFVAWGWSFIPETPSFYGIEDVKTTDPVQNARYMRLLKGYLKVDPAASDLQIRDLSQPFVDFLNIRYVYVPPEQSVTDQRFVTRYHGSDGTILENQQVLPRYFFVEDMKIEPDFDRTVWLSRAIKDYRKLAFVDHIPETLIHIAPFLGQPESIGRGGTIGLRSYTANATTLDVNSDGWNLLVTSDVHWPGWRAYWNGKRQRPVTVNGAFVGCFIPPGRGQLVLRYVPEGFAGAARTSAVAAVVFALGLAGWTWQRRALPRGTTA